MVMNAYPAPFDQVFSKVVAKLGKPQQGSAKTNMFQWFAKDGGKCVSFFMTKASHKGTAASGVMTAKPANCEQATKK